MYIGNVIFNFKYCLLSWVVNFRESFVLGYKGDRVYVGFWKIYFVKFSVVYFGFFYIVCWVLVICLTLGGKRINCDLVRIRRELKKEDGGS